MQHRYERIALETVSHRIVGVATLAAEGYRSRLSDLLNAPERDFISLTDASVELLQADGDSAHHDFIAVHRQHIVFAVSLGEATDPMAGLLPAQRSLRSGISPVSS